jgi:hypothetical protein
MERATMTDTTFTPATRRGLQLFVKYAYPPNELGYCGPDDHRALLDYGTAGAADRGLEEYARKFQGPWPYLTLMAGVAGLPDPFDERLVEAYWVGNELLDRVSRADFGLMVETYFKARAGRRYAHLVEAVPAGAVPNHSFHVFGVYPWVGLLSSGRAPEPLYQLDRCRIRWGEVLTLDGDRVTVRYRPLAFDGVNLFLGPPEVETATRAVQGQTLLRGLAPGDHVSLHWHWVCDRLDARQLDNLRRVTARHLDMVNHRVAHSGPGSVMAGG